MDFLARIKQPSQHWELIVVNNNCTDETDAVLEEFSERLPLRRIFEAESGIANARNAAIRVSAGEYIVWTDDDVLVDPGWLCAYERAIETWPDAAFFGGPVRLQFEGTPPPWLIAIREQVAEAFAARDLGNDPIELDSDDRIPYGPNYVVRTREQRLFPYDPALGRKQMPERSATKPQSWKRY